METMRKITPKPKMDMSEDLQIAQVITRNESQAKKGTARSKAKGTKNKTNNHMTPMDCDNNPLSTPSASYNKAEITDMEIDDQEYLINSNPEIRVKENGTTSQSEKNRMSILKSGKTSNESQLNESKALSPAPHLMPKTSEKDIESSEKLYEVDSPMMLDLEELPQEQQCSLIAEAISNE
jgi:hypothetical protein